MSDEEQKKGRWANGRGARDGAGGDGGGDGDGAPPADGATAGDGATGADERMAALSAERDELKDRMLRIAAEFENWKRRARKEQDDAEAKVREGVLKDILDVMDNLERAVGAYGGDGAAEAAGGGGPVDGAAVLKGVSLVLRLFQSKLDRYGVKAIVTRGQPFDPRKHEAISRVETSEVPAGSVATELQRGYMIGDRLLRPAMVGVATAPASSGGGGGDGLEGGSA